MDYTISNLTSLMAAHKNGFQISYADFAKIIGKEHIAEKLLACLFRWTDWSENHEAQAQSQERDGWIKKSAKDLDAELNFTRRNYERARNVLVDLGIVQCKRQNAVHGMMTWKLNIQRLTELVITKVYGGKLSDYVNQDRDDFRLPEFIPVDLWNAHLKALYQKKKKKADVDDKKKFVQQLTELRDQGFDIRLIMQKSIDAAWFGYFDPTTFNRPKAQQADDGNAASRAEYERQMAKKRTAAERPPDTHKTTEYGINTASQILNSLNGKKPY